MASSTSPLPSICSGNHQRTLVVTARFLRVFRKRLLVCADCYHVEPYNGK